jgi:hypothetical protein
MRNNLTQLDVPRSRWDAVSRFLQELPHNSSDETAGTPPRETELLEELDRIEYEIGMIERGEGVADG